jgi:hypothetical protein
MEMKTCDTIVDGDESVSYIASNNTEMDIVQ